MDAFWGEIRAFAFSYAPQGWASCSGNTLNITQNQTLYAVIGATYGGDGRVTFMLPDLRGRAPMDSGTAPSAPPADVGDVLGEPAVTLTQDEIPLHTHVANGVQGLTGQTLTGTPSATTYPSLPRYTATNTNYDGWTVAPPSTTLHPQALGVSGGGGSHSNLSPYLALNFCICIDGAAFPIRP